MATIGQRQFQDGAHKYLSIGNEEWSRTLKFGNRWRCLRILTRMAVTPNGTGTLSGTRLVIGVGFTTLSGRTYNAVNTMNFVGIAHMHTNQVAGQDWTYTANSGNPYYTQSTTNGGFFHKYDGVVSNTSCNNGLSIMHTNTGTVQRRTMIGNQIWKPGAVGGHATNISSSILSCIAAATYSVDFDDNYFRDCTANGVLMSGNGTYGTQQQLAPIIAGGEGSRPWDSVQIFWNLASFPMEIYDIVVVRLY